MSPTSQCVTRVADAVEVDEDETVAVEEDVTVPDKVFVPVLLPVEEIEEVFEEVGDFVNADEEVVLAVDVCIIADEGVNVNAGLPDTDELIVDTGLPDTDDVALTVDVADVVIADDGVTLPVDVRDAVVVAVVEELLVGLAVIDVVGDFGAHSEPALKSTPHTWGTSNVKRYVQSNRVPTSVLVVSSLMSLKRTPPSGEHANVMCAWRCTLFRQFFVSPCKKFFVVYIPFSMVQLPHVPHVPIRYCVCGLFWPFAMLDELSNWVTFTYGHTRYVYSGRAKSEPQKHSPISSCTAAGP